MTAQWNPWRDVTGTLIAGAMKKKIIYELRLLPGQRGDLFLKSPAGRMLIQIVQVPQPNSVQGELSSKGEGEAAAGRLCETHILGNEGCRIRFSNEFADEPMDLEIVAISLIPANVLYSFPSRGGKGIPDENITDEIWDQRETDISAGSAYGSDIFDVTCNPTRTVVTVKRTRMTTYPATVPSVGR